MEKGDMVVVISSYCGLQCSAIGTISTVVSVMDGTFECVICHSCVTDKFAKLEDGGCYRAIDLQVISGPKLAAPAPNQEKEIT